MRRFALIAAIIGLLLGAVIPAFAGDIPESLLHSEEAQLFFGEVLAYHPDKERPQIDVSPVAVIKGNVIEGTKQIYNNPNPVGDIKIKEGRIYLFTYVDEANYIDIFDVTTYDTRTLKLKHVEGSMWERFEEYLNEGKYGEARVEGMTNRTVPWAWVLASTISFLLMLGGSIFICKKMRNTPGQRRV